ncbi:hypothetical protein SNK03_004259 [Fusarium graminearum]
MSTTWNPQKNKTYQILKAAEEGGYGVVAPIVYNIEHILAFVQAAEVKRSPLIIQFFPWAITFSKGLLIHAAAHAAREASVPVAIHLDHAQDAAIIRHAADNLPFDSIMVDMSHYEMEENLAKTKELVSYCHARGIATEAEPGRIEGGEDGIADTADLEGALTTEEQVEDFIATEIDFLAPAFGNVHGEYGKRGPVLEFDRYVNPSTSLIDNHLIISQTRKDPRESQRTRARGSPRNERLPRKHNAGLYQRRCFQDQCQQTRFG